MIKWFKDWINRKSCLSVDLRERIPQWAWCYIPAWRHWADKNGLIMNLRGDRLIFVHPDNPNNPYWYIDLSEEEQRIKYKDVYRYC